MAKRADYIVHKHTARISFCQEDGGAPKTFTVPANFQNCDPFTSITPAMLLPLAMTFGWNAAVQPLLEGARDMDEHFSKTNPRHNLPMLLALTDLWNDAFLKSHAKCLSPFSPAFRAWPSFVAALQSQTRGTRSQHAAFADVPSATVIDAGFRGTYNAALYRSARVLPSELLLVMDPPFADDGLGNERHDALVYSFFAHADLLAFGARDVDGANGNRPSTLLICGKCDAFTCGQLLALEEHRVAVYARLWDVDSFPASWGTYELWLE